MGCNRILICLFSLCLVVLGLCAGTFSEMPEESAPVGVSFQVGSGQHMETIACWEDDENRIYVFLPGYAELSDVRVQFEGDNRILINGVPITEGESCAAYAADTTYELVLQSENQRTQKQLMFVKSGNIPAMYIDVQSGNMDYIHRDKNNEETGTMRLYDAEGNLLCYDALQTVKGRGNSSWGAEKKPYNLTLSAETDLLGMGAAQKWVLLSEGTNDLNIRNKIVYDYSKKTGLPFTPDCEWVNLYLNGEYAGLYLLTEHNEVHQERVNVEQMGSFLVSMEYESRLREQKFPYILTQSGQALRIRYTQIDENVLQQQWQTVENAILDKNGVDPVSGKHWRELIDVDSWAKKYLIEEIFANVDAGSLSQFYFGDGRNPQHIIFAGPVWDYDFSMGGEGVWLKPYTDYYTMNRGFVNEDVFTPWYPSLYQQEEFIARVKELYGQEFLPLLQRLLNGEIEDYWMTVQDAAKADGVRWQRDRNSAIQDFSYIQSFLEKRMTFLSDLWISETEYHTVCVDPGRYGIYGYFAVKDGGFLPELPSAEALGGLGWYHADLDVPFDVTQPIYEDVHIYMKKPETTLPVIHLAPLAGIMIIMVGLLGINGYRDKKNRRES